MKFRHFRFLLENYQDKLRSKGVADDVIRHVERLPPADRGKAIAKLISNPSLSLGDLEDKPFRLDNDLHHKYAMRADPTPDKAYYQMIAQWAFPSKESRRRRSIRLPEDEPRTQTVLDYYNKNKNRFKTKYISKYEDFQDLEQEYLDLSGKRSKAEEIRDIKMKGAKKIVEKGAWAIYEITTPEAACYYGKGTQWCTAMDTNHSYALHYLREGPLYIFINKRTDEKFQASASFSSFMDSQDRDITQKTDEKTLEELLYITYETFYDMKTSFGDAIQENIESRFLEGLNQLPDELNEKKIARTLKEVDALSKRNLGYNLDGITWMVGKFKSYCINHAFHLTKRPEYIQILQYDMQHFIKAVINKELNVSDSAEADTVLKLLSGMFDAGLAVPLHDVYARKDNRIVMGIDFIGRYHTNKIDDLRDLILKSSSQQTKVYWAVHISGKRLPENMEKEVKQKAQSMTWMYYTKHFIHQMEIDVAVDIARNSRFSDIQAFIHNSSRGIPLSFMEEIVKRVSGETKERLDPLDVIRFFSDAAVSKETIERYYPRIIMGYMRHIERRGTPNDKKLFAELICAFRNAANTTSYHVFRKHITSDQNDRNDVDDFLIDAKDSLGVGYYLNYISYLRGSRFPRFEKEVLEDKSAKIRPLNVDTQNMLVEYCSDNNVKLSDYAATNFFSHVYHAANYSVMASKEKFPHEPMHIEIMSSSRGLFLGDAVKKYQEMFKVN